MDSGEEAELSLGGADRLEAGIESLERSVRERGENIQAYLVSGQWDEARQGVALESQPAQTGHCSVRGEVRLGGGGLTSYRRDRTLRTHGEVSHALSGKGSHETRTRLPASQTVTAIVGARAQRGGIQRAESMKATL